MILWIILLACAIAFPHLYGIVENRLFIEHGEYLPDNHFRFYHVWLTFLFGINALLFSFLLGSHLLPFLFMCVYQPFGLDWVWWVIRYYDIKYRHHNDYDGGIGKPWHSKEDWDNYGGFDLIFGTYWWWYLSAILSASCIYLWLYLPRIP